MSLEIQSEENLFNANNVLSNFLSETDPMVLFSKEIRGKFKNDDFTLYYSKKGRNGISPSFLTCVSILQWRENLSDTETAEACVKRLDWKIALGLTVEWKEVFDPSTLCRFRKRLIKHEKMSLIFDKILDICKEKGFIQERSKQRIDATHVVKHINRISTTDLLFRAVKALVIEIEEKAKEFYENKISEDLKERYSKTFSSFGLSKVTRSDKQAEIVEDGLKLKLLLSNESSLKDLNQLSIMEKIFSENVIIREKEINEKIFIEVDEIQAPKQTIFDPTDTTIKLGVKGKTKWVGSKCHVVETAEKGKINFITGMIQQAAQENDNKILPKVEKNNESHDLKPEKLFADSNYISSKDIKDFKEKNQELMGFAQQDSSQKPDDYKLEKFEIDMSTFSAVCPAGNKSEKTVEQKNGDYNIYFSKAGCANCPAFQQCVGSSKEKRRRLNVGKNYVFLKQRREEQKTKEFRKEMKVRAQVEGTISELVRFHGLRKIKYKGEKGREMQFLSAGVGLNIKRLFKALTFGLELQHS